MKKIASVLSIVVMMYLLIACNNVDKEAEAIFIGEIMEINHQNALVDIIEGEILQSGNLVSVNLSVNSEVTFTVGDKIKVGYTGAVQESYPLGVQVVYVELIVSPT